MFPLQNDKNKIYLNGVLDIYARPMEKLFKTFFIILLILTCNSSVFPQTINTEPKTIEIGTKAPDFFLILD